MYAARRVLTTAEVADLAQVDERTVRRAVKSGDLPSLRLTPGGGLIRFGPADVDGWIGNTHPGEDPHAA